ncbi:hypothetical protein GIB67_013084 [Kingdonia uniflora]|uniref:Uncharacterized protein n=1 Tax=Kingdonia uniflora TaxID=39325 RepID=A0A7J7LXA1_9MAGN|nr:hypothetical protein GIB67_013084 [Kingdonia uniflora]
MGYACSCITAKDSSLPNIITNGALHQSAGYSPSWSSRWDNLGHVAGETENPTDRYSHVRRRYVVLEKTPVHEGIVGNLITPVSDLSMGNSFSTRVRDLTEISRIAYPSSSKLSFSMSELFNHSFSRSYPLPGELMPSRWARRSPGHQLLRGVFNIHIPGFILVFKSPNNNFASEGRQSFVLFTGSSDGWSMIIFLVLVASSQRDRWSFDSETFSSSGHSKMTRENSPFIDLRTCGVCSKLLTERSSGSEGKCPKIGSSSSVRNVFAKPFLKHNFSLGSKKMIKFMIVDESPVRRMGFWARYR